MFNFMKPRTNFLPKGEIKLHKTGKYFFEMDGNDAQSDFVFLNRGVNYPHFSTILMHQTGLFDTVEECLECLYVYAYKSHLESFELKPTLFKL